MDLDRKGKTENRALPFGEGFNYSAVIPGHQTIDSEMDQWPSQGLKSLGSHFREFIVCPSSSEASGFFDGSILATSVTFAIYVCSSPVCRWPLVGPYSLCDLVS